MGQKNNRNLDTNNNDLSNTMSYMWIDKYINDEIFQIEYYNPLFNNERPCIKCDRVEPGIEILFGQLKSKETTIIISGSFFPDFCKKYNKKSKEKMIFPSPIVVVFCIRKEEFKANLNINNNYDNNYLLNEELIFTKKKELFDFINEKTINKSDEELIFNEVKNLKELIIPCFYPYVIQDVTQTEINCYNQNIISNYHDRSKNREEQIRSIIRYLKRKNLTSKDIIKYWLNIYTMNCDFFKQINRILRKKEESRCFYEPLIKICYEGIRKKFLKPEFNKKFYRGGKISKIELEKLMKKLEDKKIKEEKEEICEKNLQEFLKVIVYSRSFLSFSENFEVAKFFYVKSLPNDNTEKIIYEIEKIKENENIDPNTFSYCSIKQFSEIDNEEEVLFFPFSCFEVTEIKNEEINNESYKTMKLKYLGKYGHIIKEQLGEDFFKEIESTKFSDDLVKEKITINEDFKSFWTIKKTFKNKYDNKFCFMLDNSEDFLITTENSISIFSLDDENKKLNINIAEPFKIVSLIKKDNNEICFSTNNDFIQIIKLFQNNYKIIFQAQFTVSAYNLLYLNSTENDVDKIMFTNKNCIYFIYSIKNNRHFECIEEDNDIVALKKLSYSQIIYITGDENNTFIHFFDLIKKEQNKINFEKKSKDLINLAIFKNYCIIGFNTSIELINFTEKEKAKYTTFKLDNKLTNIINFNNDKLIMGLYDEDQNISIIRELTFKYQNNKLHPYIIGEGNYDEKDDDNIKNIMEINNLYILVNTKKGKLMKLKKKNEFNKIFKNIYNKYNKNKIKTEKKKEEYSQSQESFFIPRTIPKYYQIHDDLDDELNNYILTQRDSQIFQKSFDNQIRISQLKNDKIIPSNLLNENYNNNIINNYSLNESQLSEIKNNNEKNEIISNTSNYINLVKGEQIDEKIKEKKEEQKLEEKYIQKENNIIKIEKKEKENKNVNEIQDLYFFFPEVPKIPLTSNIIKPKLTGKKELVN